MRREPAPSAALAGQTAGVSVFVDPMMAALDLTRTQVSTAYLVGTLGGALAMPRVGRLIDDRGARLAMAIVGVPSVSSSRRWPA